MTIRAYCCGQPLSNGLGTADGFREYSCCVPVSESVGVSTLVRGERVSAEYTPDAFALESVVGVPACPGSCFPACPGGLRSLGA